MKLEIVEIVLEEGCVKYFRSTLKNVRMVVDPSLVIDHVRNRLGLVKERSPIFSKKYEFLVENIVVNPADLASCAVIRYVSRSLSSFFRVDRYPHVVKNINDIAQICAGPPYH